MNKNWIDRDLSYVWHPCSQMKDYLKFHPIEISHAKGSYLYTERGNKILDAISSWWCKSLGHGHPKIIAAVQKQLSEYEHVIGTNTCQKPLVKLSELLCEIIPFIQKVFYTGDGSCAIEVAMKMALHAQSIQGESERQHFLALRNGYHGETALTLSVSDLGLYKDPYASVLKPFPFIDPVYVSSLNDPLFEDCSEYWPRIEATLNEHQNTLAAILFEPIVQGAGGMRIYSADFLKRLSQWAKANHIYLIADEIMTGIGRTGEWLASMHAKIEPDFICLSKGLTSGFVSFSAIGTSDSIYELFFDDYENKKNFLHSQTYSGNAIGASAALATIETIIEEDLIHQVKTLESKLHQSMQNIADSTPYIKNVRSIGAIAACELNTDNKRLGFDIFQEAIRLGAFLRPLGNTVYWIPPYNINDTEIRSLEKITQAAIETGFSHQANF